MNATLYEISADLKALEDLLTEVEGDVTDPQDAQAVEAWRAEFAWQSAQKIDGYVRLWLESAARAAARREEAARLREEAQKAERLCHRLEWLAQQAMQLRGVRKLEGQVHSIGIQANGGSLPVEVLNLDALPREAVVVKVEPDKAAIRRLIELGQMPTDVARLGERGSSVRFR